MIDKPQGFDEFKAKHPEYFKMPDGTEDTLEKQYAVYNVIAAKQNQQDAVRRAEFKKLDDSVEALKKDMAEDKEWQEPVYPVTKPTITQRMRELLEKHHINVALAHILEERFGPAAQDGGDIRYDKDKQMWVVYNGKSWVDDPEGLGVIQRAEELLYDLMLEACERRDTTLQKKLAETQGSGSVKAALVFLKPKVAVNTDVFDTNPALINMMNGTYDVSAGKLHPHRKNDYITRIAGVEYDSAAKCPKWLNHLRLVIPDAGTRLAFQVFMGHTLVAGNPENAAMFAYGSGKNGKTVSFATIDAVLHEYAISASPTTFAERFNDDSPRPDLARMKGARLITVPEGKQGRRLDEGVLKNLTGGSDDITARFLYGRDFSFKPTAKLCFHTNHLPKIIGRDNGIWRRIYPIPFTTVVPTERRIPDYDKLMYATEGAGIFNWLVKGYKYYKMFGNLIYTSVINEARELYKDKEDVLGDFFEMYKITGDENDRINRAELYQSYKNWCGYEDHGEKPYTKNKFNDMVEERVGSPKRIESGGVSGWFWIGIKKPDYTIPR